MKENTLFLKYWGKAASGNDGDDAWHLLVYHSLDVAASGVTLLQKNPRWQKTLSRLSGLDNAPLEQGAGFLLALHDLGKFFDAFQNKRPDLFQQRHQRPVKTLRAGERHDLLGARLWRKEGGSALLKSWCLPDQDWEDLDDWLQPWIHAVIGHHGRPPCLQRPLALNSISFQHTRDDAWTFVREMETLFLSGSSPFSPATNVVALEALKKSSWLLAGLAVASDWIGSNRRWFPYRHTLMPLERYWHDYARPQAERAVRESGLFPVASAPRQSMTTLFPTRITTPSPMQTQVETMALEKGPHLFILEDATGSGKTEAAVGLAHRLMAQGDADGFFFALPTMATANAMVQRVAEVRTRLFDTAAQPVLILSHSARHLMSDHYGGGADTAYGGKEEEAEEKKEEEKEEESAASCHAWLQDHRKKSLLAHLGVGTLDQALLGILPVRHQSLRLLGVLGKVLIVDEVHASDPYLHRLLCVLLRFHAAFGGSAILLSATLPDTMRTTLLESFACGAEWAAPTIQTDAYPLVTHLSQAGVTEQTVAAHARRHVALHPLLDQQAVHRWIKAALAKGHAVCWIRNTVADAATSFKEWTNLLTSDKVILFHARFALGDRLDIESDVVRRFGRHGLDSERRGCLLIATQVVEQSLDLDFDAMVSDLAPADLLIQRAGRLHRHRRGQRAKPTLGVYMPNPDKETDAQWYARLFPKGAFVYPHHGQLWLTARWLWQHKGFSMPEDARGWMACVYGEQSLEKLPEALAKIEQKAEGDNLAEDETGRQNTLQLAQGYGPENYGWTTDENAPTRLGAPTVTLRLARWHGSDLVPWREDKTDPWAHSQVSVRASRIHQEAHELNRATLKKAQASMPDRGRYCVVIPLEPQGDTWVGRAINRRGDTVQVAYDPTMGLTFLEEESSR